MGIAWLIYVTSVDELSYQYVSILPKKLLLSDSVGRGGSHEVFSKIRIFVGVHGSTFGGITTPLGISTQLTVSRPLTGLDCSAGV